MNITSTEPVPHHRLSPHSKKTTADGMDDADAVLHHERQGVIQASCSVWWRKAPRHPDGPLGCIGRFQAADLDAGKEVLSQAVRTLKNAGCRRAVGPMDGSTWRSHRLVTWSSGEPPFCFEPAELPSQVRCFEEAGFRTWMRYSSSVVPLGTESTPAVLNRVRDRLAADDVCLEPLRRNGWERTLREIHALTLHAFAANFLFAPITLDAFVSLYRPIEPLLDPDLVLLARRANEMLGFVFALPDPGLARTLVVKTLAVAPDRRLTGLGSCLVDEVHRRAAARGFTRAVHALQREDNASLRITKRHGGRRLREYALFQRVLAS